MVRIALLGAILVVAMSFPGGSVAGASEDPARSFAECVLRGGDLRRDGDDLSCRHIASYTMRTYLTGTTACGEKVEYEIWDVVRYGTVSWLFASRPTATLPEAGATWPAVSATPIPCVEGDP